MLRLQNGLQEKRKKRALTSTFSHVDLFLNLLISTIWQPLSIAMLFPHAKAAVPIAQLSLNILVK